MDGSSRVQDASYLTICAYHKLASEPSKRAALCKDDTSLQFLVYILDSTNEEIIKTSLKTLLMLSEQIELRPILSKVFGLQQALQLLVKSDRSIDNIVLSRKIYSRLFSHHREQAKPLKDIHNTSCDPQPANRATTARKSFVGKSSQHGVVTAKILVFQVKGLLNQNHRRQCEEQMLNVKGLISITFSMSSCRFLVRAKPEIKPETVAAAISRTEGMSAQQVVKNESGQEVLISFGTESKSSGMDKENSELPAYLSDDDSPVKEKALARSGIGRRSDGGWLSSATNFISRSFYW